MRIGASEGLELGFTPPICIQTSPYVMSVEIDWPGLTTGPEGLALAESIRDFVNEKFQSVQLPRFIRSVKVHSFDFGDEAPVVELKDLGDPLAEFYEDEDSDSDVEHEVEYGREVEAVTDNIERRRDQRSDEMPNSFTLPAPPPIPRPTPLDIPRFSRSSTPGVPGGTSNLSYFHLPLSSAGLSGTSTPLAAVAGGNAGWGGGDLHAYPPFAHIRQHSPVRQTQETNYGNIDDDPNSRPSTANNNARGRPSSSPHASNRTEPPSSSTNDLQVVLHISYTGNVRLSMTAEILLDYPMSSFVGIPLKLNITGLSFDGVAIVAYLRKRAHFCFVGEEEAQTLLGTDVAGRGEGGGKIAAEGLGGLLKEIRVESEIGRQEGGKQVLRNVGKVEKFVLEQVRRIFEEELVWPSFWTFLV
ncbi:MAG: hypothetical protein Q9169_004868 [Polycauliona sp. 2 TL-2023]